MSTRLYEFKQYRHLPKGHGGVCATLASYWIKLMGDRTSRLGHAYREKMLTSRAKSSWARNVQSVYVNDCGTTTEINPETVKQSHKRLLSMAGNRMIEASNSWVRFPVSNVLNFFKTKGEHGVLFTFSYQRSVFGSTGIENVWATHTIAVCTAEAENDNAKKMLYLFDPDSGEWAWPIENCDRWFKRYMKNYYGGPGKYRMCYACQAKAFIVPKSLFGS